jgi:hypothetical protein
MSIKKTIVSALLLSSSISLAASEYTNTSYYVNYDSTDATKYVLVMPSANKMYTLTAGQTDLSQVGSQFASFPTYENGELCFSALASSASGDNGASTMAGTCHDVKWFYTQKDAVDAGTSFMLYYKPQNKVYELVAGDASSMKVVKDGTSVTNSNSVSGQDYSNFSFDLEDASVSFENSLEKETVTGSITSDTTWTNDKIWVLEGLVSVTNGATLTIEAGTTVAGAYGTGANTSYLVIDKDSKIMAEGTADNQITFTSEKAVDGEDADVGQWGGVVIIGNAANSQVGAYEANEDFVAGDSDLEDNSGVLKYVKVLNSGITMETDKEINGLSFVGVGSGTTVENITVNKSDDDCIELWGGTVNLTNIDLTECTDDYFDIDDGYAGAVTNLTIVTDGGNAGIEMSGNTAARFENLDLTVGSNQVKEGGIYFKKDGIGGHFANSTITMNATNSEYGAIHSAGTADTANISFDNVTITGANTEFTGDSGAAIKAIYDAENEKSKETVSGEITTNTTWTNDKIWVLEGLVSVTNGATLTIEAGTTVAGAFGTGANTSYLVIDKDSKIEADGTVVQPITFTSEKAVDGEDADVGQWGGVVIIGNAANSQVGAYEANEDFVAGDSDLTDNSGTLRNVRVYNSGITMETDKEINGLSFVGVGSGTTVENITVNKSDDDCIELWGGTVNLTNINLTECTDDYFDIDDGYAGTVTGLTIVTDGGNAGIEMSGNTAATFDNLDLTVGSNQVKEGGIYFKKDGIGGHFMNSTITMNATNSEYGAIHSAGTADTANISFENVEIKGANTEFTGDSGTAIENIFISDSSNTK